MMQSGSRIILASAWSGKTTTAVLEACDSIGARSALITYTINGHGELEGRAYEKYGSVPDNVFIGTWFSFVLTHFVRPYQNHLYAHRVSAINFERIPDQLRRIPKSNTKAYFFSSSGRIWRDRVTDFACQLIEATNGLPIRRIERIFGRIYIDEAQDLSGWDLELIEHLLKSKIEIVLVGAHRQATYSTNNNPKNKQFAGKEILNKFLLWEKAKLASIEHHAHSHRCVQAICDFADAFFPDFKKTTSRNIMATGHDGIFLLRKSDLEKYEALYSPQSLRYDKKNPASGDPLNFGEAKGMTFERTLIFPHGPFLKYIKSGKLEDAGQSIAKIYVGITRAKQSVAIVVPDNFKPSLPLGFALP